MSSEFCQKGLVCQIYVRREEEMALYSESVMLCNLNGDGNWLDVNGQALETSYKPVGRQKPVLVSGKSSFPVKRRKSVRFRNNSENGLIVKNGDTNGSANGDCSDENEEYRNGNVNRGVNGERIISIQDHDEFPESDEEGEAYNGIGGGKIYSVRDPEELSELGEEQEVRIKLGEAPKFVRSMSSSSRKSSSDCFVRSELKWVFLKHKPKVRSLSALVFKVLSYL